MEGKKNTVSMMENNVEGKEEKVEDNDKIDHSTEEKEKAEAEKKAHKAASNKILKRMVLVYVFYTLLMILFSFLRQQVEGSFGENATPARLVQLFSTITTVFLFVGFAVYIFEVPFASFFQRSDHPVLHYGIGFLQGFVLFSVLVGINVARGTIRFEGAGGLHPLLLLLFLVGFMLQSYSEELMMRGFVQRLLLERFGLWIALFVPSVGFGLLHLGNPHVSLLPIISTIFIGLAFALQTFLTGDFWMSSGLHCAWNFFMGAFYGLPVSGMAFSESAIRFSLHEDGLWTGGAYGMEASLLATVVIVLFTAMLFYRFIRSGVYHSYREPGSNERLLRYLGVATKEMKTTSDNAIDDIV